MEFQAVVLCCGDARRLHPLTSDERSECMLHVATQPLLWYPLAALKKAAVESVILVRRPSLSKPTPTVRFQVLREGSAVSHVRSWLVKEHNALPSCEVTPSSWV